MLKPNIKYLLKIMETVMMSPLFIVKDYLKEIGKKCYFSRIFAFVCRI